MTAATAQLCGHRWRDGLFCTARPEDHRCAERRHHLLRPHRCDCGATTTRETGEPA